MDTALQLAMYFFHRRGRRKPKHIRHEKYRGEWSPVNSIVYARTICDIHISWVFRLHREKSLCNSSSRNSWSEFRTRSVTIGVAPCRRHSQIDNFTRYRGWGSDTPIDTHFNHRSVRHGPIRFYFAIKYSSRVSAFPSARNLSKYEVPARAPDPRNSENYM